jgi:hypothetical protein
MRFGSCLQPTYHWPGIGESPDSRQPALVGNDEGSLVGTWHLVRGTRARNPYPGAAVMGSGLAALRRPGTASDAVGVAGASLDRWAARRRRRVFRSEKFQARLVGAGQNPEDLGLRWGLWRCENKGNHDDNGDHHDYVERIHPGYLGPCTRKPVQLAAVNERRRWCPAATGAHDCAQAGPYHEKPPRPLACGFDSSPDATSKARPPGGTSSACCSSAAFLLARSSASDAEAQMSASLLPSRRREGTDYPSGRRMLKNNENSPLRSEYLTCA